MRIVICGSILFSDAIRDIYSRLEKNGHKPVLPASILKYNLKCREDAENLRERKDYISSLKPGFTRDHFDEIKKSDAILVVNVEKRGIPNYIGGATFAEIVFAFYLGKKIFLLNPIPMHEKLAFFREEIEATQPVVINGDLRLVK